MHINIHEILKIIPHRYPFILVDKVISIEENISIHALKNVTINEPYFCGHFPGNPVMPGVLILEALAQAGALLAHETIQRLNLPKSLLLFAGIDNARFKQVVLPGDQLHLKLNVLKSKRDLWKMDATALVEDKIVCTAELLSIRKEF